MIAQPWRHFTQITVSSAFTQLRQPLRGLFIRAELSLTKTDEEPCLSYQLVLTGHVVIDYISSILGDQAATDP